MKRILISVVTALVLASGLAVAGKPARNVSPGRHPNLAAAQRLVREAFEKITAAQKANEWDMNGHAQKAKELLDQVSNELKDAAVAANENKAR